MKLRCFNCQETYDTHSTSATDVGMYCSIECEEEELARLVEGNGIVANAEANNPLAFGKTQLELAKQKVQSMSISDNRLNHILRSTTQPEEG